MNAVPELTLVIPTYNEKGNILILLEQAESALSSIPHEIIVVDDASPDGTGAAVEGFSKERPAVRLIERRGERGLSGAVLRGFEAARSPILAVMDADLSHDPRLLPRLYEAVRGGAEMAVGSRRVPGGGAEPWPWHRRRASDAATWLARIILGVTVADPMSGYFMLRKEVYEKVRGRLQTEGYKILLEIICRARPGRVVELPYVFKDRHQGVSKLSAGVGFEYLRMLWRLRRDA